MSTSQELSNNKHGIIRRIYKNKTYSINLPKEVTTKLNLKDSDYMKIYISNDGKIVFEKLEVEENV